jgi:hypothetical protein
MVLYTFRQENCAKIVEKSDHDIGLQKRQFLPKIGENR